MKTELKNLPEKWKIIHNDILDDNFHEDMFQAEYEDFVIDAGFYSKEFCICLLKGNFSTGELFEKIWIKSQKETIETLFNIMQKVQDGFYYGKTGYKFSEDDETSISDYSGNEN